MAYVAMKCKVGNAPTFSKGIPFLAAMEISLKGKRALVGGASQGIGLAIANELALLGAEVTCLARREDRLREVVEGLDDRAGQSHRFLAVDFADIVGLEKAVSSIVNESTPIHILINNTGGPKGGPIAEADLAEFSKGFSMHVLCNQTLSRLLLPGMKDARYGRIINIISTSVKQPIPNLGVSNTIRAAVANWAKTLSLEVASHGITVNNVLPGFTDTERLKEIVDNRANMAGVGPKEMLERMSKDVPAKRVAKPEEIAYAVGFLAGPSADYINGINLPVDGGRTKSL